MGAQQVFGICHGLVRKRQRTMQHPSLPSQDVKTSKVREGLHHDFWIEKLATNEISTTNHLVEFVELWSLINEVHLVEGSKDDITWKLTNSGEYSAASA
jgi:hypothetical protein